LGAAEPQEHQLRITGQQSTMPSPLSPTSFTLQHAIVETPNVNNTEHHIGVGNVSVNAIVTWAQYSRHHHREYCHTIINNQ